jgi:hypothetical protein
LHRQQGLSWALISAAFLAIASLRPQFFLWLANNFSSEEQRFRA